MYEWIRSVLRVLFKYFYRVEVSGLEHYHTAGSRVLIIANHTSFLDGMLIGAFLPGDLTFAINTHISKTPWMQPFLRLIRIFPMNPSDPLSTKALIRYLEDDHKTIIFPEGRITVTGALMKTYGGAGMVALRSGAMILPVRIDGAQYTPFSRLRGRLRLRLRPTISLCLLAPRRIEVPMDVVGRERRRLAGRRLADIMTEMMFATSPYRRTLFAALIDARRIHGGGQVIVEDITHQPLTYTALIARALMVGGALAKLTSTKERVGVLLPNMVSTVAVLMGLSAHARVPAMLNFTVGTSGMLSAAETACLKLVVTSRRFVAMSKCEDAVAGLSACAKIVYLEDLSEDLALTDKLKAVFWARVPETWYRRSGYRVAPDEPAIVLFTSGSEGTPKGVVLSHANLLANREQLAARIDFRAQDIILNALPMFHSFGLTGGTLLPLFCGMRTFFYPSPLHYRIVPEMAYAANATVLFGTNTFLAGYARFAHPYDFYSVRYVFAGAEKLQEETRRMWTSKFGVRIFEGYGTTETSPVIASNTPMDHSEGTVGRFLPGIIHYLEEVPGIDTGGRLFVKGPNIMLGYLLHDTPGVLHPPSGPEGPGWYDTGDIVSVDDDGFVQIRGRAKRFAKVAGEMVSLAAVEALAALVWPGEQCAAVALPDPKKGEQVVLMTDANGAKRAALSARAKLDGVGEINVPKRVMVVKSVPVLGTGKIDYAQVGRMMDDA